jgi:hypothetical protein
VLKLGLTLSENHEHPSIKLGLTLFIPGFNSTTIYDGAGEVSRLFVFDENCVKPTENLTFFSRS